MNVIITGDPARAAVLRERFLTSKTDWNIEITDGDEEDFSEFDIIFDVNFDDHPETLQEYANLRDKPIFVNVVKLSLSEAVYLCGEKIKCQLFGFNSLEAFVNDAVWEVSFFRRFEKDNAEKILGKLQIPFRIVEDRVGLVKMRVISMIINEACFTLQEGTATMEDIDISMKLGTNYPHGPFEWCDRIGVSAVFETLAALYEDTKDERYKICPLLKRKYLRNETFYKQPKKA